MAKVIWDGGRVDDSEEDMSELVEKLNYQSCHTLSMRYKRQAIRDVGKFKEVLRDRA